MTENKKDQISILNHEDFFRMVLLAVIAVGIAVSETVYSDIDHEEWRNFKTTHGKSYAGAEDTRRMGIYMNNKQRIAEHNEKFKNGEASHKMAINQFADLLPEEIPRGVPLKIHLED